MNNSRMDAAFPCAATASVVVPYFNANHRNRNSGEFHFETKMLKGIFPVIPTLFTDDNTVDPAALRSVVRFALDA